MINTTANSQGYASICLMYLPQFAKSPLHAGIALVCQNSFAKLLILNFTPILSITFRYLNLNVHLFGEVSLISHSLVKFSILHAD